MTNQELRKQLEQLHSELEQTSDVDPETARELSEIDRHIQALLRRPDRELVEKHHTVTESLREALVSFGNEHPQLTIAVERVLDAFTEMGI